MISLHFVVDLVRSVVRSPFASPPSCPGCWCAPPPPYRGPRHPSRSPTREKANDAAPSTVTVDRGPVGPAAGCRATDHRNPRARRTARKRESERADRRRRYAAVWLCVCESRCSGEKNPPGTLRRRRRLLHGLQADERCSANDHHRRRRSRRLPVHAAHLSLHSRCVLKIRLLGRADVQMRARRRRDKNQC